MMMMTTMRRQRGALSLLWVAILSALLAALAMAALFSMRSERNLFAEGDAAFTGAAPARQAIDAARGALSSRHANPDAGAAANVLRKCVIAGKPVVSNTDCLDTNQTSRTIRIHTTRGIEAPKPPPAPAAAPTSDPAIDKMIEKQLR